MLKFVLRKMINKKWMVLALLIGNILLIGITCSNPMYTHAILQRTLTRSLAQLLTDSNTYPGVITVRGSSSVTKNMELVAQDEAVNELPARFGVDALEVVHHVYLNSLRMDSSLGRDDLNGRGVSLGFLSDFDAHTSVAMGRRFSPEPDEDGVVEAMVSQRALIELNLMLDEELEFKSVITPSGEPLRLRVVGTFINSDPEDVYWVRSPISYSSELIIPEGIFREYFMDEEYSEYALSGLWYVILDYRQFTVENAAYLYETSTALTEEHKMVSSQGYRDAFRDTLKNYLTTEKKVRVTLLVLQVPIFVLLAAFIFMVSRQMLEMEQNEIAVIKSRGAGRRQILTVYLVQSLIVAVISLAAGLPLGAYLTQVLGSSNAFMEFVRRSSLTISWTGEVFLYAGAAALLSIGAMVLPVIRYSKVTIVSHKQKKNRSERPAWEKYFLDVIALGVAVYGLYSFNNQKAYLAQRVLDGASLDPLLFLSSSLFMIGAGLVALRVLPLVIFLIYRLFRRWWSPALYVSYLRVLRTRSQHSFIMVFLIMTIALGVFNADAARTINSCEEENLRYRLGADVVVQENWDSNADAVADNPQLELVYTEPDYGRYATMEGAASVTRVQVSDRITVNLSGGTLKDVRLMGINTREFGETAWFDPELLPHHWYEYLNAMGQNARAILVSENFRTKYGYKVGDPLSFRSPSGDSLRGVIYGFVSYFPSYCPVTYTKGADGVYQEKENFLIVANLSQLQAQWGVLPYQVWMKTKGSSQFIYDFAREQGISYQSFSDVSERIVALKNDPIFQGTNGILTVGFIVVLLLCAVGFLIYWILSIQSRALQFGIFRAMGMSMREILTMLINEHVYISGVAIALGVVVGKLTSRLYMPLIQMAYAASDNALPLKVASESQDMVRIMGLVGAMLVVCLAILGALISRMKIAQALKLGED